MMERKIWIHSTIAGLNLAAASQFSEIVTLAIQSRGFANVSLSGGETPKGVYRLLAQYPYQSSIRWDKIHFYWGDERCVPPENPESNYGQVLKALLNHVSVQAENIHPYMVTIHLKTPQRNIFLNLPGMRRKTRPGQFLILLF